MGEYAYDMLRGSCHSNDPRLRTAVLNLLPPSPGSWVPWARARARVMALRLGPEGHFGAPVEYTSVSTLAAELNKKPAEPTVGDPSRRVYILEGLCPQFVSLLGAHFQLHPSIFMDHERLVPAGGRLIGEGEGIPFLPSTILGRDHVVLKYHEPLVLSQRPTGFRNLCDTSGRHIAVTRLMGQFSDVGICRRKCTFWSKKNTESGRWECLIICDPPIRHILSDYSARLGSDIVTSPYGSGYLDFMPLSNQIEARSGPPRSSLLEDLLFYLRNHCDALDHHLTEPQSLQVFVVKVVASHFLKLAEFLQTNINIVQWHRSRRQDLTSFDVSVSEELWSDVQSWQRRIAEY